uniref:Uncharacterized protein n=1 Tax=Anguilla anguilla TaxID=7936 RepID=A0A0E9PAB0_ANGAN
MVRKHIPLAHNCEEGNLLANSWNLFFIFLEQAARSLTELSRRCRTLRTSSALQTSFG